MTEADGVRAATNIIVNVADKTIVHIVAAKRLIGDIQQLVTALNLAGHNDIVRISATLGSRLDSEITGLNLLVNELENWNELL